MDADRLLADEQALPDLAVGPTLGDERRGPRARGHSARTCPGARPGSADRRRSRARGRTDRSCRSPELGGRRLRPDRAARSPRRRRGAGIEQRVDLGWQRDPGPAGQLAQLAQQRLRARAAGRARRPRAAAPGRGPDPTPGARGQDRLGLAPASERDLVRRVERGPALARPAPRPPGRRRPRVDAGRPGRSRARPRPPAATGGRRGARRPRRARRPRDHLGRPRARRGQRGELAVLAGLDARWPRRPGRPSRPSGRRGPTPRSRGRSPSPGRPTGWRRRRRRATARTRRRRGSTGRPAAARARRRTRGSSGRAAARPSSPASVSISTIASWRTQARKTTPTGSQLRARSLSSRASGQRPSRNSDSATLPARKLP